MVGYMSNIEKVKDNYSAYCPDLPGVIATGPFVIYKEPLILLIIAVMAHVMFSL